MRYGRITELCPQSSLPAKLWLPYGLARANFSFQAATTFHTLILINRHYATFWILFNGFHGTIVYTFQAGDAFVWVDSHGAPILSFYNVSYNRPVPLGKPSPLILVGQLRYKEVPYLKYRRGPPKKYSYGGSHENSETNGAESGRSHQ
jgi:hypothetical protein